MIELIYSFLTKVKSFLVIGDVMLDKVISGDIQRISPEAPVPVVSVHQETISLGGAANVCVHLASMGQKVSILGIVGDDAEILFDLLDEKGIDRTFLQQDSMRPTTTKSRIVVQNNQQIARLDKEKSEEIPLRIQEKIISIVECEAHRFDAFIISDYSKGLLTPLLLQSIFSIAKRAGIPTFVDPKACDIDRYKGAFLIKPNRNELSYLSKQLINSQDDIVAAAKMLSDHFPNVLVTLGAQGMLLVSQGSYQLFNTVAQQVYDVTAAGDTVLAYVAASMVHGFEINIAVNLANFAAGRQVTRMGTSCVSPNDLLNVIPHKDSVNDMHRWVAFNAVRENRKIVFTNGCFDILHAGHVQLLKGAKALGDILVVGLNSDRSIIRLKGISRPINNQINRASVLHALECVDFVFIFEQDTANELIERIKPNIYVKSEDKKIQDIPELPTVRKLGGEIVFLPFLQGVSTTNILYKEIIASNIISQDQGFGATIRSKAKTFSVHSRANLLTIDKIKEPNIESIRDIDDTDFQSLINAIKEARKKGRPVIVFYGAHVVKCGLSRYLIALLKQGFITHIASNGAGSIHDFELCYLGGTSEDVASALGNGSFGMWEETGLWMNEALHQGIVKGLGYGASLAQYIESNQERFPFSKDCILYNAWKRNIPTTFHIAVGTDIIHQHPSVDFSTIGATSGLDFYSFCDSISKLEGGVFINFGSSVIGPEVFLKALAISRNLGYSTSNITTANFDLLDLKDFRIPIGTEHHHYYYRPRKNIVNRPTQQGGIGWHFNYDHMVSIPALYKGLVQHE